MTHEDFTRKQPERILRDRAFGLMFTAVLSVVALLPLLRRRPVRWWALLAAAVFLVAAVVAPALLAPFKRLWMRFGHLVSTVASHCIAAILLVVAFAPARLLCRLSRRDPLALRWDPKADTYWVPRDPPGPPPGTMINQF